jgi:hypothetical protein
MTREDVYNLIDTERNYQDNKWGARTRPVSFCGGLDHLYGNLPE